MKKVLIMLLLVTCTSCYNRERKVDKEKLLGRDYRLFQDTPAWDLAKAVDDEDVSEIQELVTEKKVSVDYPETRFGCSLLILAIENNDYKSVKALLELGADPNRADTYWGATPMHAAAQNQNSKYLKLLLAYRGNPSVVENKRKDKKMRDTPLNKAIIYANGDNLDNLKLLVEAGADLDAYNEWYTTFPNSPLSHAIISDRLAAALYLLQQGARYDGIMYKVDSDSIYILEALRCTVVDLDSKEYTQKRAVINFLKTKGLDYDKEPIPDYIRRDIIKRYPDDWQEYLKKY